MTALNASTVRRARRSSTFVVLSAAALLVASCGAGEDSANGVEATPANEGTALPGQTTADDLAGGVDSQAFATADLVDPEGGSLGTVEFTETDAGTEIHIDASDLPPGFHGLHIHSAGLCEPDSEDPDEPGETGAFLSAEGHLAGPDEGAEHPDHAGDLPPLFVTEDGTAQLTTLSDRLDRDLLLDEDGSAVIIHEDADNLAHIPERYAPEGADEDTLTAGDGGSRIACGELTEQS